MSQAYCLESDKITIQGEYYTGAGTNGILEFQKCVGEGCATEEEFQWFMKDLWLGLFSFEPYFDFEDHDNPIKYSTNEIIVSHYEFKDNRVGDIDKVERI